MFRKAQPSIISRFGLPEKWKGGRIEKYVNYWKGVARDYKESTKDIIVGSRNKPFKATTTKKYLSKNFIFDHPFTTFKC